MNDLEVIDIEMIRRMRREGRGYEADSLLDAYHENLQKQRKQQFKEIKNVQQKKQYYLSKSLGLCTVSGCVESVFDSTIYCENHLIISREYRRKSAKKRRERSKNDKNNKA